MIRSLRTLRYLLSIGTGRRKFSPCVSIAVFASRRHPAAIGHRRPSARARSSIAADPQDGRYDRYNGGDERLAAVKMLVQPLPSFEIVVLKFGRFHGVTRKAHRKTAFEHEGHGFFDLMRP